MKPRAIFPSAQISRPRGGAVLAEVKNHMRHLRVQLVHHAIRKQAPAGAYVHLVGLHDPGGRLNHDILHRDRFYGVPQARNLDVRGVHAAAHNDESYHQAEGRRLQYIRQSFGAAELHTSFVQLLHNQRKDIQK